MLNNKSIAAQTTVAFIIKAVTGAAGYILFSLISRLSNPEVFGNFSVLFSLAMVLGVLGSFGQQIFIVKNIAISRTKGSVGLEKGIYVYSCLTTLIGSLLSSILFAAVVFFVFDITSMPQIILGSTITLMFGITQTTTGLYRIDERTIFAIFSRDFIWRVTSIALSLLAYLCIPNSFTLTVSLLIVCIAFIPSTTIHIIHAARKINSLKNVGPRIELKSWLETSTGLALIAVISSADLYLFTIFLKNNAHPIEIGAFFAASKTVELINMFLMAATLISSAEISKLIARKDAAALQRQCNSTLLIQATPSLLCCISVAVSSPWILSAFDPAYREYSSILSLLCIGMIINSLAGSTGLLLQLGNMHWQHALFQGGSLFFALTLLPTLTDHYGINGAALAFIGSKSIWNVLAITIIRKNLKIDPSLIGLFSNGSLSLRSAVEDVINQIRQKAVGRNK